MNTTVLWREDGNAKAFTIRPPVNRKRSTRGGWIAVAATTAAKRPSRSARAIGRAPVIHTKACTNRALHAMRTGGENGAGRPAPRSGRLDQLRCTGQQQSEAEGAGVEPDHARHVAREGPVLLVQGLATAPGRMAR